MNHKLLIPVTSVFLLGSSLSLADDSRAAEPTARPTDGGEVEQVRPVDQVRPVEEVQPVELQPTEVGERREVLEEAIRQCAIERGEEFSDREVGQRAERVSNYPVYSDDDATIDYDCYQLLGE